MRDLGSISLPKPLGGPGPDLGVATIIILGTDCTKARPVDLSLFKIG